MVRPHANDERRFTLAKQTLDELKARMVDGAAPVPTVPEQPTTGHAITRIRAECSPLGAAMLLTLSALDQEITGFPGEIPLIAPNGTDEGLSAKRSVFGTWELEGSFMALRDLSLQVRAKPTRRSILSAVLGTLGVPRTDLAFSELSKAASWEGSPTAFALRMHAASKGVPIHVTHAALGLGTGLVESLGGEPDEDHAHAWIDAVKGMVDLDGRPGRVVPPAMVMAARRDDWHMFHPLKRSGASIESADSEGNTPALVVAAKGDYWAIKPISEWGGDWRATNLQGKGALHLTAGAMISGSFERVGEAGNMFRLLVDMGCDPSATDNDGNTPGDILRNWDAASETPALTRDEVEDIEAVAEWLSERVARRP